MIHSIPIIHSTLTFLHDLRWWNSVLPEIKGMVKASVVFGTPGKNCQGLGLCKAEIMPAIQQKEGCCPKTFAYIGITKTGRWEMRLSKVSTSGCIQMKYLQKREFRMEESFQFSKEFYSLFNISNYTIQAGNYCIKEAKTYYIIIF